VVVNKVDKPGANPDWVINAAFDLFDKLGATDEQLDFPVVYASGINGWSSWKRASPVPSGARTCRPCSTPS
jgi:GTP-binding protein